MGLFSATNLFGMTIRESANDGSDFTNPDADYRRLFLGEDGLLHVKDSAGTVTAPYVTGSGTGQGLVDYGFARRTSGDVTITADAVWANVDTGMDLTLTASSGHTVEVGVSVRCANTTAVSMNFDVVSIVSAAPVNSFSTGAAPSDSNDGVAGWRIGSSLNEGRAGSIMYTLQAGDITGGTVVCRLRVRTSSTTNRDITASAVSPLVFWAKNLGAAM